MILSLRQRHCRTVFAMGIFLPIAFAVGIAARKPAPIMAGLPSALVATAPKFESVAWERGDLFKQSPVRVRLLREHKDSSRVAFAFSADIDFVKPDLIVYWIAGTSNPTDTLPDQAIFLGAFGATALPLRDELTKSSGSLILFSLANGEIVDVSKPILCNDSTK